jgi:hypothetical protein
MIALSNTLASCSEVRAFGISAMGVVKENMTPQVAWACFVTVRDQISSLSSSSVPRIKLKARKNIYNLN